MMRRVRRFFTWVALIVMLTLIAGYIFVTDRTRVKTFVEQQTSRVLGATVTIGDARLSIFEGLRLDDVRVKAGEGNQPPIFQAKRLHVSYDPRSLFRGDVAAERVVAVEPRVRLVEDLDNKRWNFQLLDHRGAVSAGASDLGGRQVLTLPEVLVRNARFDYAQIENGRESEVSTLQLEGQFTPDASGLYRFRVQSRSGAERAFPSAEGWLKADGSAVGLTVSDVDFVDEIKSILPAQVRRFWESHRLSGRLDQVALDLFRKPNGQAGFRVQTDLSDVSLSIPPTTWMGPQDRRQVQQWQDAFGRLASPTLGASVMAGRIVGAMTPESLRLKDVDARFTFTDERIAIERLRAHVDENALEFSGHIDGYAADAAAELHVRTPAGQRIVLTPSPGFIGAMPWPVQEIYYRFRPIGSADLWLDVTRTAGAPRPTLAGEMNVTGGTFTFDRMPYPVERASGKFRFGNDPVTRREMLEIVGITGHGPLAGPNGEATLAVNGTISPLDETAGADIHITGRNVQAERKLIESLPPLTQKAVLNFDAEKTGRLPTFRGEFACDVQRAVGLGQPWLITTKLDLLDGSGLFKGFPYPLKNVTGSVRVYDDHVDLAGVHMPAGGGTAELGGTINWIKHDAKTNEPLIQTDLQVKARNVPIDAALMNALPANRRKHFERLGLSGRVEVDGQIEPSAPDSEDPAVDLQVKLTNGRAKPTDLKVDIDDLRATVRVKGERADVDSFDGKLGGATIVGTASADATDGEPRVLIEANVSGLRADAAPLDALPPDAAKSIRSLHARGDVDVDFRYAGDDDYRVVVRPLKLSVTPEILPLRFDGIAGRIVAEPKAVRLEKLTAKYGDAPVSLDGTIDPKTGDADVSVAGRDLVIDAPLTKALPTVLGDVVNTLTLTGPVAIDCPKLVLKQPTTQPVRPANTTFDATLWLQKTSMKVAADLTDVVGRVSLAGNVDGDTLGRLDGKLAIDEMTFAGRKIERLNGAVAKRPGEDLLRLTGLSARVAGGQVAGQIETVLSRRDPRFGLNLLVRNAKVSELTGEAARGIEGTLTASLAMEGRWDDPRTRRGLGDVQVNGREMVKIPLVFGLMQVANLSLPNREPIRQAGMRYIIQGPLILLNQIDLRSTKSVMQGDGTIDFDKSTVDLRLSLGESPADNLPLFGDLIKSTRQDLMQVRLQGSLTAKAGTGGAFSIFDSSVSEVKEK